MNDIASIQKINNMSQELKRFGFADDRQSSIEQASNILLNDEEQQASQILHQGSSVEEIQNKFVRYKDANDSRVQKLNNHIDELKQEMQQILSVVSAIQSRRESAPQQKPQPSPQPEQHVEPPRQERSPEEKEESRVQTEEKPYYEKQGLFTSNDVQIDKIFYYGNK
jgi:outer membrane biosynthesis protein TonB